MCFVTILAWLIIACVSFYLSLNFQFIRTFYKHLLAKFLAWHTAYLADGMKKSPRTVEMKRKLFAEIGDVVTKIGGPILELGAGNGSNLAYYPEGSDLITIDLNDNFKSYLLENVNKHTQVKLQRYLTGTAEDMRGLVESESCSCVVSSLLLCCVDQEKTLSEVMRVLKPGGCFYFIEHVVEQPGTFTRWFQHRFTPLWSSLRANCHLQRNTDQVIQGFGFERLDAEIICRDVPSPLYFFAKRSYVGCAFKPL